MVEATITRSPAYTSCEDDLDLSWDEPLHGFTDTEKETARKLNPFGKYLDPSIRVSQICIKIEFENEYP